MTVNANQRVENIVLVPASDKGDKHAAVTKLRFYLEDGSPVDIAGLIARVDALEGKPVEEEVAEDDAQGADGDANPDEQPAGEES